MADNVDITPGTGVTVAADDIGGVKHQRVKIEWGADGTANDTDTASGKALPVQIRNSTGTEIGTASAPIQVTLANTGANSAALVVTGTGTFPVTQSGTWTVSPGNTANTTAWLVTGAGGVFPVTIAAGATSVAANEDDASADGDRGLKVLARRTAAPANTSGTDLDYEMLQMSAGRLWTSAAVSDGTNTAVVNPASTSPASTDSALVVAVSPNSVYRTGMAPRGFAADFTTLTRPANTTSYTALDSISNSATAGSVTALSATISDVNDDPISITAIRIISTDTGLAGKQLRAYVFNSNPTSSSGVGAGDNATYNQKVAGYIGSFSGIMETGFSDGSVGRLVPTYSDGSPAGALVVAKPVSGARTLYIQYQAIESFTPSANSTTIIGTAVGYQARNT